MKVFDQNNFLARQTPPFQRVLYINLDKSTQRREHMETMLGKTGLASRANVSRWRALEPSEHPEVVADAYSRWGQGKAQKMGASVFASTAGCRASHTAIMEELIATGRPGEHYLVLEDDVELPSDFEEKVTEVLQAMRTTDWDVIHLSCWGSKEFREPALVEKVELDGKPDAEAFRTRRASSSCSVLAADTCWFCGGTHAMVYNYDRLYRVFADTQQHGPIGIDCALSMPYDANIKSFCVQMPGVRLKKEMSSVTTRTLMRVRGTMAALARISVESD